MAASAPGGDACPTSSVAAFSDARLLLSRAIRVHHPDTGNSPVPPNPRRMCRRKSPQECTDFIRTNSALTRVHRVSTANRNKDFPADLRPLPPAAYYPIRTLRCHGDFNFKAPSSQSRAGKTRWLCLQGTPHSGCRGLRGHKPPLPKIRRDLQGCVRDLLRLPEDKFGSRDLMPASSQ